MSKETMISVTADIPRLDAVKKALSRESRKEINSGAAASLYALCKGYLLKLSASRHKTAHELGAEPKGHLVKAARTMTFGADADGGYVAVHSPGFRRVFGDMQILPDTKPYLTIPVHALAYGKRVSELKRDGIKVVRPKGKDFLISPKKGGGFDLLYVLSLGVRIPQDRSLLPSDREMSSAARNGAADVIELVLERARSGGAT